LAYKGKSNDSKRRKETRGSRTHGALVRLCYTTARPDDPRGSTQAQPGDKAVEGGAALHPWGTGAVL